MIDIDELNEKYSLEGEIGFTELEGDLVFMTVTNKYADADICLYGAQLLTFTPVNRMDMFWVSPESHFEEGEAIRGGIPVCFPWFGPHPTDADKPQHGFGRLMYWEVAETASRLNGETFIRLQLNSSDKTKAYWPHDFKAELAFIIGQSVNVSLKVTNTSNDTFDYTCALHSYFGVSAIENITIEGLKGARYHSQLEPGDFVQDSSLLKIEKAETRHYHETDAPCVIDDPVFRRRIRIEKKGSTNTTVWNPGAEACKQIGDTPDEAYHSFVCVETVNAFEGTIQLQPGESHETTAMIGLEE
ncbi:MAG TPA: D-hexose-6-phosphate mutarotase [Sunxiuqinia sp.]|nr:D-hexose-6-phosphate mutarotase [Sunxiuqinia sp.]